MARQLDLLPALPVDDDWRLDASTIETGRRGIARARAALAAAQARTRADHTAVHHTAVHRTADDGAAHRTAA